MYPPLSEIPRCIHGSSTEVLVLRQLCDSETTSIWDDVDRRRVPEYEREGATAPKISRVANSPSTNYTSACHCQAHLVDASEETRKLSSGYIFETPRTRSSPIFFPPALVIPDPVLNKLVSGVANVHTVQSIWKIFARARFSVNSSLLRDKEVEEIFNLVNYMIKEHIHMLGIHTLTFQTSF